MALTKYTRDYIDSQIDYYISEASAYKEIAEQFVPEVESIDDTAFGIIAGCVYSSFLQIYTAQKESPNLQEIQEFNKILKDRAPLIKKALKGEKPKIEN